MSMSSFSCLAHPGARIDHVYELLGGEPLRRNRARAAWRPRPQNETAHEGWNVAFNVAQGVWFDHVEGIGGGVLDLIVRMRGGDQHSAAEWLSGELGILNSSQPRPRINPVDWKAADRVLNWRVGRELQLESIKAGARSDGVLAPAARELFRLQASQADCWPQMCESHWLQSPREAAAAERLGKEDAESLNAAMALLESILGAAQ